MIRLILLPLIPIFIMMARSEVMAWQRRRREQEDNSHHKKQLTKPREYDHNWDEEDDRNSHS